MVWLVVVVVMVMVVVVMVMVVVVIVVVVVVMVVVVMVITWCTTPEGLASTWPRRYRINSSSEKSLLYLRHTVSTRCDCFLCWGGEKSVIFREINKTVNIKKAQLDR